MPSLRSSSPRTQLLLSAKREVEVRFTRDDVRRTMLNELKVSNFAIIDNIHIEFTEGFNVISGETGAGKSVLLKSLSLLMGEKSGADLVRTGHEQASVEGVFDLSEREDTLALLAEHGVDTDEGTLVVRRL